ncbi:uncharacterized protein PRCAT00002017001 [Priceomyces carsonii]|uniref:uncharacterized protein n=1 Tax=Priceomyces carsonii TaxID=28549 RepID=UPI002EDA029D|nr:unnamed protein product [Priceomyces carsonii]
MRHPLVCLLLLMSTFWSRSLGLDTNYWNTLYSLSEGKIYVHLNNNDVIKLNFSITGFSGSSQSGNEHTNLIDNQIVTTIKSPPLGSTLFLVDEVLYGLNSQSNSSSSKDLCGTGALKVVKYNDRDNKWTEYTDELNFDEIEDTSFYAYPTILTSPVSDEVFIYGGLCGKSNEASSRLLSFDPKKLKFSNVSTATKPQPFYGAANVIAPSPQKQLVVGGQSNGGWLSMNQLATWDFSAGWSFEQVPPNAKVEVYSRKFALALPVFEPLANDSEEAISDYYKAKEIVLVGGEVLKDNPSNLYARLSVNTNSWSWSLINATNVDYSQIAGAATIFETLVIINSSTTKQRRLSSSSQYAINLYDVSTFESVSSLKDNTKEKSSKSSSDLSLKGKAILGTVLPISIIALVLGVSFFFLKKRRDRQRQEAEENDYQIGNFYDQESREHKGPLITKPGFLDSNSTIDVASIDSWVRKRQEFDLQRGMTRRDSYFQSNETLNHIPSDHSESDHVYDLPELQTTQVRPALSLIQSSNKSLSKLRKSISFTGASLSSPAIMKNSADYVPLKKKLSNINTIQSLVQQANLDFGDFTEEPNKKSDITKKIDKAHGHSESESSLDDNLDVQVLVSSKRRSALRIVNPDLDTVEDQDSTFENVDIEKGEPSSNIRQRVPSNEEYEE